MSNEDRMIELETRSAYHEDLMQSLNDTVVQQQRKISALEQRYQILVARLAAIDSPAGPEADGFEVPPHY